MKSIPVEKQERIFEKDVINEKGVKIQVRLIVSFDTRLGTSYNVFNISIQAWINGKWNDNILPTSTLALKYFPEVAMKYIKYVQWSSICPPCYIGMTFEYLDTSDIEFARENACWPNATEEELNNETLLMQRLPGLMKQFKRDIKKLGFTF